MFPPITPNSVRPRNDSRCLHPVLLCSVRHDRGRTPTTRRRRRAAAPPIPPTRWPTRRCTNRRLHQCQQEGPPIVVIPGEVKSNNASFTQKFGPNNIADYAELGTRQGQLQGAGTRRHGTVAQRVSTRLHDGRSEGGPQGTPEGKIQDHQVGRMKFDIPQRRNRSLRRIRALTARRPAS